MSAETHRKSRKSRKQAARQGTDPLYRDLLLPLLLVMCVLPLIVRLEVYDTTYGGYVWYPDPSGIRTDLFAMDKSRFFVAMAAVMLLLLLIRAIFFRKSLRWTPALLPLASYGAFVCLSAAFARNSTAAVRGTFDSFENVFVLLGYCILTVYVFETVRHEEEYRILWRGFLVIFALLGVTGLLQILRVPLYSVSLIQRLIMSDENYAVFGGTLENTFTGRNVYATLFNPNNAGVYFAMASVLLAAFALTEQGRRKKICYLAALLFSLLLLWFTYSRTALIGAAAGLLFTILGLRHSVHLRPRFLAAAAAAAVCLLLLADALTGFHFLSRIKDSGHQEPLGDIVTEQEYVSVTYAGTQYRIRAAEGGIAVSDMSAGKDLTPEADGTFLFSAADGTGVRENKELPSDGFSLMAADLTMNFVYEDGMWQFLTPWGARDRIEPVRRADFHGLEYLGSARLYIWSRVLPLLGKYAVKGAGPDSFPEVFPQNDYAGKAVYADRTDRIIEKAHNDFLNKWIESGGLSVICYVIFLLMLLIRKLPGITPETCSYAARLKAGAAGACLAAAVCSFFVDSSVQTSPLLFLLAGIVLT